MRIFLATLFFGLSLAIALPLSVASAQTSSQLEGVIFSQVEKRIIHRWLGEQQQSRRNNDRDNNDDDDDDDEAENEGKSQKGKKGNKGKPKGKSKGKQKKAKGKSGSMPKGLAKKGKLPPGLAKRKELPPGLVSRGLPTELEQRLPPPQQGTERKIIEDGTVLLVEAGTNIVLDILEKAIRGNK